MSVHKSQGSEFDEVAVLLPPRPSPVLSRELLYTAVTRARQRVTVHATWDVVKHAITHRIDRASGLRDALWGRG
jgi:exodeoxyribonuclease V alpha subunit